ncbi:hypothetical protein WMY93_013195 [Mugilogobius chulae]|uniref:L1 transposable element RRM domain-containing protein n=1 Tax=Mugilogobius chulae TaxID=88201 RepID=A0AAW0PAT3_9GOBI
MGKPSKKQIPATEGQLEEENCQKNDNQDTKSADGASYQELQLTRADMEEMLQKLEQRIVSTLSAQLSADRAVLDRHDQTIQQIETSMNDMQSRLLELESTCTLLKKDNEALKRKTDDLENRSRRNNIRVIGLPEKAEGPHPSAFLADCMKEIFGPNAFASPLKVDRAHRINVQRRNQDAPRPFIARIHHYQHKELLLNLAREKRKLMYRGAESTFSRF